MFVKLADLESRPSHAYETSKLQPLFVDMTGLSDTMPNCNSVRPSMEVPHHRGVLAARIASHEGSEKSLTVSREVAGLRLEHASQSEYGNIKTRANEASKSAALHGAMSASECPDTYEGEAFHKGSKAFLRLVCEVSVLA
eukprot:909728-Amphidinium_carterae.7